MGDATADPRGAPDPRAVVGPVIRDLVARRLARSYLALVGLGVVAVIEFVVVPEARTVALLTLGGAALSALALLARGMNAVRRVVEESAGAWSAAALLGGVLLWTFALWLLGIRGLRSLAMFEDGLVGAVFAVAWVGFGIRLLRDMIRVGDVVQLARVMIVPSPEEAA